MNMVAQFSIGTLAREVGVKVVTIRYYEKIGILPSPERTPGNYRSYTPAHAEKLRFIRRCRELGFQLEDIRDLSHLSTAKAGTCTSDMCDREPSSRVGAKQAGRPRTPGV